MDIPEGLWQSDAKMALIIGLCFILGQIAGRAVEALISKKKNGTLTVDPSWIRRMDEHAKRSHQHATELQVLTLRADRTDRRVIDVEKELTDHILRSETSSKENGERLVRIETISEAMKEDQDAMTGRLDKILDRLSTR